MHNHTASTGNGQPPSDHEELDEKEIKPNQEHELINDAKIIKLYILYFSGFYYTLNDFFHFFTNI